MLQDHGDKVLHCARFFRGSKDDFLLLLEDDVALASDFWARASAANSKWLESTVARHCASDGSPFCAGWPAMAQLSSCQ